MIKLFSKVDQKFMEKSACDADVVLPQDQPQQMLLQPAAISTTEAFVQSVIRAMNIPVGMTGVTGAGMSSSMSVVASCALAVAASAVANAAARRITAVPDMLLSCCETVALGPKEPATTATTATTPTVRAGDRRVAGKKATTPSSFLRLIRFVLRILRSQQRPQSIFVRLLEWLERRASRKVVAPQITVPEKCSNDSYGAKPNVLFSDLVWYAMTHASIASAKDGPDGPDAPRALGCPCPDGPEGIEVVQEAASGAIELRCSLLADDIFREYEHDGHRIFVVLTVEESATSFGTKAPSRSVKLSTPAKNSRPINAFIAHVQALRSASQRDEVWKPVVHHWHGSWTQRRIPGQKRFEHVAMRAADKRTLMADVEAFLGGEAVYRRMGLCWNRGYLLHGPPGCGKSSCVSAMACTYRLPVYSVNLREVSGDVELRSMFASLPERVLVVMEDVDCMTDSILTARVPAGVAEAGPLGPLAPGAPVPTGPAVRAGGPSLSGLLNVLDGIETGGGRILVMTTNHKAALDPALVRPGRCDVHLEVGYCTFEHVAFLVALYLGETDAAALDEAALKASFAAADVTPAEVAGLLMPLVTGTLATAGPRTAESSPTSPSVSRMLVELCRRVASAKETDAAPVYRTSLWKNNPLHESDSDNSSSCSSGSTVMSPVTPSG
jgi:hypothetical protein